MYNNLFNIDSQEHGFAVYSSNSPQLSAQPQITVADPDLQIKVGSGHPDQEIKGGGGLKKFFLALWASVWSKNKWGGGGSPLDQPLNKHPPRITAHPIHVVKPQTLRFPQEHVVAITATFHHDG